MRTVVITTTLVATLLVGPPASVQTVIASPLPNGVVDFGDSVRFALSGDCTDATTHVEVTTSTGTVSGPSSVGCSGLVTVPSEAASGYTDGEALAIEVVSGAGRVQLRYMRLHLEHADTATGSPVVVDANDMRGGGRALRMASGDVVALGRSDLEHINSVSVRSSTPGSAIWELRVDRPDGPALTRGGLGDATDAANYNFGWRDDWSMVAEEITTIPPERAPELFFAIVAAAPWVDVNHIDLNGTGIRAAHATTPDPPGTEVLFDGSSFDGWSGSGFTMRDGAMRGSSEDGFTGTGELTWDAESFTDAVFRMRFRAEAFEDNAAILVGNEIQIRGSSEWFPGGYWTGIPCAGARSAALWEGSFGQDCGEPAERIKLNAWPDWSDIEIAVVGATYRVTINGRVVTRHVRRAGPPEPFKLTLGNQPEFSFGFDYDGSNILAGTGPQKGRGNVWFDDVRVYRCTSGSDPACTD